MTATRERLSAFVATKIQPLVIDRGATLELDGFEDSIVRLRVAGSPGAVVPVRHRIADMLRHYFTDIDGVVFEDVGAPPAVGIEAVETNVRRVLDEQINPAVRAHGGFISLVEIVDATAFVRMEQACQGCAMAHVTLRQGIEVLLTEQVPGIVAVVDATDHASGTRPYFETKKQ